MASKLASEVPAAAIRTWLYAVAALIFAMVLVGGATRLTESGLSITEWKPVLGVLPPLSTSQWQAEFQKYQAIPQYRELNAGMTLGEFQSIYWWEWTHRLLGRAIGVVFLLPFLWFLLRGFLAAALARRLWLIFGLGALQGAIGWWMVASGLVDRVEVSQYRLATHLVLACLIYAAVLWTAQRLPDRAMVAAVPGRLRAGALGLLGLVLVQIYFGALVAGLRAGYIYNTWPLIDGAIVPDGSRLFFDTPWWRNLFENTLTVQFVHRMLAYTIVVCAVLHAVNVAKIIGKGPALTGALTLLIAVMLQAVFGVLTLLFRVPIGLALLHQGTAMLVLSAAVIHAASVCERDPRALAAPARA